MENISSGLKITVGILVTIAIIAIGIHFFSTGKGIADTAGSQLEGMKQSILQDNFQTIENGSVLTGAQVVNFIRSNSENAQVTVKTKKGASTYTETYGRGTTTTISSDITSNYYIAPNQKFTVSNVSFYTDGTTVNEVTFTQD